MNSPCPADFLSKASEQVPLRWDHFILKRQRGESRAGVCLQEGASAGTQGLRTMPFRSLSHRGPPPSSWSWPGRANKPGPPRRTAESPSSPHSERLPDILHFLCRGRTHYRDDRKIPTQRFDHSALRDKGLRRASLPLGRGLIRRLRLIGGRCCPALLWQPRAGTCVQTWARRPADVSY